MKLCVPGWRRPQRRAAGKALLEKPALGEEVMMPRCAAWQASSAAVEKGMTLMMGPSPRTHAVGQVPQV